jgi:hypothetical protein
MPWLNRAFGDLQNHVQFPSSPTQYVCWPQMAASNGQILSLERSWQEWISLGILCSSRKKLCIFHPSAPLLYPVYAGNNWDRLPVSLAPWGTAQIRYGSPRSLAHCLKNNYMQKKKCGSIYKASCQMWFTITWYENVFVHGLVRWMWSAPNGVQIMQTTLAKVIYFIAICWCCLHNRYTVWHKSTSPNRHVNKQAFTT